MAQEGYVQLADTSFVVNGKPTNVLRFKVDGTPWVLYEGENPADSGSSLFVGTDGHNYGFYTWDPEGGHRLYPYHPAYGSPEDEKNRTKSQEIYTRAYGNDKPKKQFGGNMNYASYLQVGGATPLNVSPQVSKEDIEELVADALNGTGKIKEEAASLLQDMMQDSTIAPLIEEVMQEKGISMQKCGGRVKKKAMGSKLEPKKVMAGGRCSCALKKVGGRLIEVDSCTGLPIHRNGGVTQHVKKGFFGMSVPKVSNDFFGDNNWGSVSGNNLSASTQANKTNVAGSATSSVSAMGGRGGNGSVAGSFGGNGNGACPVCLGSGVVNGQPCTACGGTGSSSGATNNISGGNGGAGGDAFATNGNTTGGSTYDNSNTASTAGNINNALTDNRRVNNRQRNVGNTKIVFRRGAFKGLGMSALTSLLGGESGLPTQ